MLSTKLKPFLVVFLKLSSCLVPIPWILFPLCMWKCYLTIKTQPRVPLLIFFFSSIWLQTLQSSPVTMIQDFLEKIVHHYILPGFKRNASERSCATFSNFSHFLCLIQGNLKLSNICSTNIDLHLLTWWFKQWEAPVCSTRLVCQDLFFYNKVWTTS